jgi:hypothetical protein
MEHLELARRQRLEIHGFGIQEGISAYSKRE